ncbi:class I SAM-dependent methyltransferase [Stomatohabitans albus]|uniref:class I SAM-dependent methyltransferase n=1 Tax=Stomatohabitans albus TaxID=3110766 RepID=UPI00300D98BF
MSEAEKGTRSGPEEKRLQGHWLLAKMGKRVLRPGGIELTRRLIEHAKPSPQDRVVEFGPGVGRTAEIILETMPKSYRGIDPNKEGTPQLRRVLADYPQAELVAADAKATGLPDESADLVVGEAMLTMHSEEEKLAIMGEAFRILAPGGRYAIHELGFCPDDVPSEVEEDVARALSRTIKVGARPLTSKNWQRLLIETGFEVEYTDANPMALLEPGRLIEDEGLGGFLRFVFNVMRNPSARERILAMRSVFRAHQENINAVAFVARKPA